MKMEEIIKKINEYAKLSKERELTDEELKDRDSLRQEYLKIFRGNFENQLKSIKIVDKDESKE
ncbi:hypothetical protein SCORR_v1c04960 [Spiroplasma corruscae]|uniref:Uncharacterized protein n=1 Tax=Spiroplasma corruscae TaxID=216934 RepID=A0A222EP37_9MOLU|nr:DUF896 domain-containing protein [Spiroplasma corruscae]ASP28268.1 hypothetical protein SCORR_v1c04960 [Spiroplasma corruscae]